MAAKVSKFGRVWIEGLVGEGANSRVYKGILKGPQKRFDRSVCLKVPKSGQSTGLLKEEFRHYEKIRSKNVLNCFGVEEVHGVPSLVLEYIKGVNLSELLQERLLTKSQFLFVLSQVAEGILDIHDAGFVHGDVKPQNIMVDSTGRTVLIDLGFKAPTGEEKGSLKYLSPERWGGLGCRPNDDFFALSLIRHEFFQPGDADSWKHRSERLRKHNPLMFGTNISAENFCFVDSTTTTKSDLVKKVNRCIGLRGSFATRSVKKPKKEGLRVWVTATLLFFMCFASKGDTGGLGQVGYLTVKTHNWMHVSVNGTSVGFTPILRFPLKPGLQQVTLRDRRAIIEHKVVIKPRKTVYLRKSSFE